MEALAGGFSGALMAGIFIAHLTALFALRPPQVFFLRQPPEATLIPVVLVLTLGSSLLWIIFGTLAGLLFGAFRDAFPGELPGMPSIIYTVGIIALAVAIAPPILLVARRYRRHLAAQAVVFIVIFAWMLPFLATARA